MKYTTEQIRIRRQNRQIAVREMHPDWTGKQVYAFLKRKWGIPEGSAMRDWRTLKVEMAERAKQAEQEGGNDGHEGQSTAD